MVRSQVVVIETGISTNSAVNVMVVERALAHFAGVVRVRSEGLNGANVYSLLELTCLLTESSLGVDEVDFRVLQSTQPLPGGKFVFRVLVQDVGPSRVSLPVCGCVVVSPGVVD